MSAAALLFLLAASVHDEKLSVSRVEVKDGGVVWTVDVALQGLEKVLKLPADPLDLSERQLQDMKDEVVRYLRTCMKLEIDGAPVEPEAESLEPLTETFIATGEKYIAHARQRFRFAAPSVKRLKLSGAFFSTVTDRHEAVVGVSWDGGQRTFKRTGPFDLELTASRVRPTFWSTASEFLLWGMHHILIGYDHIAFLLALLLGAKKLGEMVRVVTSFTVAHSLTLLLAALDRIRIAPAVTESLIALSIVYVAAENYFIKNARHRWVLTFAFGLVHGLGFSSVLRERLQDLESVGVPVVFFNLGVEFGQLAILLVMFPVLFWIRKAPDEAAAARRQRKLVIYGSAPILLMGLALLVDRVFQRGWFP
ncbi:MAG: HupE/UreJ family protein [Planctomycetes bacterium]|nr:HupE/UreJ family protein [Planctomycetota bacterium]